MHGNLCAFLQSCPARGRAPQDRILNAVAQIDVGRAPQGVVPRKWRRTIRTTDWRWSCPARGRAPQGARGLKSFRPQERRPVCRRAPQGARGLKTLAGATASISPRGRAPQGARGLKNIFDGLHACAVGRRAPQGARGLKRTARAFPCRPFRVVPRKGHVD